MPSSREGVAVEGEDGRVQTITLTVAPLRDARRRRAALPRAVHRPGPDAEPRAKRLSRDCRCRRTAARCTSRRELRETRERLQSLIEEYETALEELKSANEELVSVNEELQSTNEELEASKEELQSVNEELHTVNAELQGKIEALDRANSDLQNLFDSTDIATVFLDQNLVIRSFTPAVAKVFNILPSDRGRPDHRPVQPVQPARPGAGYRRHPGRARLHRAPCRARGWQGQLPRPAWRPTATRDQKLEGVVVTFVDVTSLTRAEARQQVLIAELQHRTRNLLAIVQSMARQTFGKGKARSRRSRSGSPPLAACKA